LVGYPRREDVRALVFVSCEATMRIRVGLVVGACLFSLPLQLPAQDAVAALLAADRAASTVSGDSGLAAALATTLSPNGVILWPGAPIVSGRQQVMRLIRGLSNPDTTRLTWQPLGMELSRDSTLGITWGIAATSPRLVPGAPHLGRYTAVWRREAGRWNIGALLFTNVVPVAGQLPPGLPTMKPPAPATGPAAHFIAADLAFARLAGDSGAAVAFRTWASADAIVSGGPTLLLRGPDAIARGVAGPALWSWYPVAAGASSSGDLGWTTGEAVIAPERGDTSFSKYLTVWTRAPGQPIRFLLDGGNNRPAALVR
jgi:hypothetical protein